MSADTSELAHLRIDTTADGVRTITLDRPDRLNAVNPALADSLPRAIDAAAADDAVRVVVLTGAGRGFCSGLDLSEPPRLPASTRAERLDPYAWVGRWVMSVIGCEKPVIAAVNGAAAGAGFGLALAADIRLVAAGARLTAGYVRRGLSPDAGVSWLLPRLLGVSRATEIVLSGRDLDADEAVRIGLAAAAWPDSEFAPRAAEYATRLAAGPPLAHTLTKRLLLASLDTPLEAHLERELAYIKACFASKDVSEAMAAFAAKRAPVFRGQ